ncbi:unnamed protein product [Echinostoma caproni]|uniref:EGF-like domain-containing protein n=1 Tax=Echinostoma caproni TaxID=27848 RepID=A0A183AG15_9TREM|nr:unnamed protein product [Echinostoma caproni]
MEGRSKWCTLRQQKIDVGIQVNTLESLNCQRDRDECAQGSATDFTSDSETEAPDTHQSVRCFTPGHVARPCCGPQAQCVNTYGGYHCVCPSGWTGAHCEYPPALWPEGYHPVVNRTEKEALAASDKLSLFLFNNEIENAVSYGVIVAIVVSRIILRPRLASNV